MKKYKILIVDDDHQLAEIARLNFPQEHFVAKACTSGADALNQVRAERPDLILLDVMMPMMDGWEVLVQLKADPHTASIPVIMCTAKDGVMDVEKSFHYGAQSYIIKPIDFDKLIRKIAAILDIETLLRD